MKTKSYNLEHNSGHGQQNLSTVIVTLNLLAFACHTACDLGDRAWKTACRELVTRQGLFHAPRTLTSYLVFPSWEAQLSTMAFSRPLPLAR